MSCTIEYIINRILTDGTNPRIYVKDPCRVCHKTVKVDHQAILCKSCEFLVHIVCNGITQIEYDHLQHNSESWNCLICNIKNNLYNLPFTQCDNTELLAINDTNSMGFLESLPNVEIINETKSFSDFSSNDVNNELPSKTSCKYYSVKDFHILKKQKSLNIFHANVNGLGSKVDNLKEFLSTTPTKMDILAITETSEKEDTGFLSNIEIEGFDIYHTSTKTSKGGTAIYVNKRYDSIERCDLNTEDVEFETTWIEIKNKRSKNIVCGNVYRHPHNNCEDFFHYLEECPTNLAKENKEVYICEDFNFDLLKVDTDNFTQYFFNLLCSYGFLPHILQPTRVTEHTATVIDNIFSNNLQDDILSGNVLLTLSDHFAQMVSVNREQIDSKKINVYQRDYSKY